MSGRAKIAIPKEQLAEFCRKHHVHKLSLFGSVLRDDFRPNSDVDVLVEFEPGRTPGLAFFAMQDELSELLGRKVDLNTPLCLSRYFRDEVLAEAEAVYTGKDRPDRGGLKQAIAFPGKTRQVEAFGGDYAAAG
jgi:hypothetical protein